MRARIWNETKTARLLRRALKNFAGFARKPSRGIRDGGYCDAVPKEIKTALLQEQFMIFWGEYPRGARNRSPKL